MFSVSFYCAMKNSTTSTPRHLVTVPGNISVLLTCGETGEPKAVGQGKAREPKKKKREPKNIGKKAGDTRSAHGACCLMFMGMGWETGVSE